MARTEARTSRYVTWMSTGVGVALGILIAVLTNDVILGVIAGSGLVAVTVGLQRLWTGR